MLKVVYIFYIFLSEDFLQFLKKNKLLWYLELNVNQIELKISINIQAIQKFGYSLSFISAAQ